MLMTLCSAGLKCKIIFPFLWEKYILQRNTSWKNTVVPKVKYKEFEIILCSSASPTIMCMLVSWWFVKILILILMCESLEFCISDKIPGDAVLLAETRHSAARLFMPFTSLPCSRNKLLVITDCVLYTIATMKTFFRILQRPKSAQRNGVNHDNEVHISITSTEHSLLLACSKKSLSFVGLRFTINVWPSTPSSCN